MQNEDKKKSTQNFRWVIGLFVYWVIGLLGYCGGEEEEEEEQEEEELDC